MKDRSSTIGTTPRKRGRPKGSGAGRIVKGSIAERVIRVFDRRPELLTSGEITKEVSRRMKRKVSASTVCTALSRHRPQWRAALEERQRP